jgi:hypothetical protein
MTYRTGNSCLGIGQAHKCGRVKSIKWDSNLPLLITGYLTAIHGNKLKKKLC